MSGKSNCSPSTSYNEKCLMHNMKICSKFLIFPIKIDCRRKTTNLSNKRLLALSSPDSGLCLNQFLDLFMMFYANTRPEKEKKNNCSIWAIITPVTSGVHVTLGGKSMRISKEHKFWFGMQQWLMLSPFIEWIYEQKVYSHMFFHQPPEFEKEIKCRDF